MNEHGHRPVLAAEVGRLLAAEPGETVVDCTLGRGGHAEALAVAARTDPAADSAADSAGSPTGRLIGFELDAESLAHATARLEPIGVPLALYGESFIRVARRLDELGLTADVVLADLGVSSPQLDDPLRGFSFRATPADAPLDMRFGGDANPAQPSAAELVRTLPEEELARVIFEYGEEPLARKIARKLVQSRSAEPIETTEKLATLVLEAYGPRARTSRIHPATRTFMALRIAVNEELDALTMLLDLLTRGAEEIGRRGRTWLSPGARVGVISFHSLEDRLVKHAFADLAKRGLATRLTKGPVTAGPSEVRENARSRSAKLRVVKIGEGRNG